MDLPGDSKAVKAVSKLLNLKDLQCTIDMCEAFRNLTRVIIAQIKDIAGPDVRRGDRTSGRHNDDGVPNCDTPPPAHALLVGSWWVWRRVKMFEPNKEYLDPTSIYL